MHPIGLQSGYRMEELSLNTFKQMLRAALERIKERQNEFSQLDAVFGDGDHGTAMVTAMNAVVEAAEKGNEFKAMLNDIGFNVMLQTSGSTSTLLGAFFMGMGDHVEGTLLNTVALRKMFAGGLKNVCLQTKAKKGDKTMMDALIPAVDAIECCQSDNIGEILRAGAVAAQAGANDTVGMKAVFGRARNYGEHSVGTPDPGAKSWACMLSAFAETVKDDK